MPRGSPIPELTQPGDVLTSRLVNMLIREVNRLSNIGVGPGLNLHNTQGGVLLSLSAVAAGAQAVLFQTTTNDPEVDVSEGYPFTTNQYYAHKVDDLSLENPPYYLLQSVTSVFIPEDTTVLAWKIGNNWWTMWSAPLSLYYGTLASVLTSSTAPLLNVPGLGSPLITSNPLKLSAPSGWGVIAVDATITGGGGGSNPIILATASTQQIATLSGNLTAFGTVNGLLHAHNITVELNDIHGLGGSSGAKAKVSFVTLSGQGKWVIDNIACPTL